MHFILVICLFIAGPALAQGQETPRPRVDYYCTDKARQRHELGDVICLSVDGRSYLARCEIALNNTIWRRIASDCEEGKPPISARERLDRL